MNGSEVTETGNMWSGCIWLRTETSSGILCT